MVTLERVDPEADDERMNTPGALVEIIPPEMPTMVAADDSEAPESLVEEAALLAERQAEERLALAQRDLDAMALTIASLPVPDDTDDDEVDLMLVADRGPLIPGAPPMTGARAPGDMAPLAAATLASARTAPSTPSRSEPKQQKIVVSGDRPMTFRHEGGLVAPVEAVGADVWEVPSSAYMRRVLAHASRIKGVEVSDYETAVSIVAQDAREAGIARLDVLAAMDEFDRIVTQHTSVDSAAIAAAFLLRENLVVVDAGSGGYEAIEHVGRREAVEVNIVKAPQRANPRSVVTKGLRDLAKQLSRFPSPETRGRAVVVKDLAGAHQQFKRELIDAIANRKIGPFPVPDLVRIVIVEQGPFALEDFPPEVVIQAICMPLGNQEKTSVDEMMQAVRSHQQLLRRQIDDARKAGDRVKEERLLALMHKTGYVGSYADPKRVSSNGKTAETKSRKEQSAAAIENLIDDLVTSRSGGFSRHEKSNIITLVVSPEKARIRRQVAEKLMAGISGRESAEAAIAHYMRQNLGPLAGKPTIEDILAGVNSTDEVRDILASGDRAYAGALAIELRQSVLVDEVMRGKGEGFENLIAAYGYLLDFEPELAEAVARERKYFLTP